jgi:hypothetical protein
VSENRLLKGMFRLKRAGGTADILRSFDVCVFTYSYKDDYVKNCEMRRNEIRRRSQEMDMHIHSKTLKRQHNVRNVTTLGNLTQDCNLSKREGRVILK